MATYTSKLNLKKPEGNELFNRVQDLNDNWDKIDAINASQLPFTPTGNLSSTNVQTALAELDTEKASKLFATNLVTNGDFSNGTTGWTATSATGFQVVNGIAEFVATALNGRLEKNIGNISANEKYYASAKVKTDSSNVSLITTDLTVGGLVVRHVGNNDYQLLSGVYTQTIDKNITIRIVDARSSGWTKIYVDNILLINLTQVFGTGNEPTKEQMDWIFTERDRLGLGHLNGTQELLPMVSLLNLINKKANTAQEAWKTGSLTNGWTGTFRYLKTTTGLVIVEVNITGGTLRGFGIMPVGYRGSNVKKFFGSVFTDNASVKWASGELVDGMYLNSTQQVASYPNVSFVAVYRAEG